MKLTYYNEVMEPVQQIPLDKNMKLDALHNYNQEDMDETSHNNEDYSDLWSPQDNKKVSPNNWDYYLGFKMKPQQRIGRHILFNLRTSQVLGNNEPCQLMQRDSTHMEPVHSVNRKRKKKRTSQGLSRIELQHVKMKNLQPLLNLFRLLVHYII